MDLKAASILVSLIISFFISSAHSAEKDWAGIVISLKPKQGQNFEQDLLLSKALFSLERRPEAIRVLNEYVEHEDARARKQLNLISTQFYNQETANIYYEAIRLIGTFKWSEARERLESALAKEPGHAMVLERLIQTELVLKAKDALVDHIQLADQYHFEAKELKIYSAKAEFDAGEDREAFRLMSAQKAAAMAHPVSMVWWLEIAAKNKRTTEVTAIQTRILKQYSTWAYVIDWFIHSKFLSPKELIAFKAQQEKNLKDPVKFNQDLEADSKRTQYYWVGHYTYESLLQSLQAPTPTPTVSEG